MKRFALGFLIFCLAGLAAAQDTLPQQAFYRARDHFDRGEFEQAINGYKEALRKAESKELLYNLGTACLFAGKNGEALYYLRRAERLAPRDEDIQRNLSVARSRARDEISRERRTPLVRAILYLHERTTLGETLAIFAVLYLAAMLFLHLRLLRPTPWLTRLGVFLLFLSLAPGWSLYQKMESLNSVREGVVLPEEVDVFSGPSDHTYAVFFKLHAGAEVRVLDLKNGWAKIEVDGKKGFLPENQLGLLRG